MYNGGANGDGNVFSLPLSGGTPSNLFSFNGTNGSSPNGSLTLSGATLYGNTQGGGANSSGEVFSIPAAGGSPTTVGSFGGGVSGTDAGSSLAIAHDGSTLYGMTYFGGTYGDGTVFSVPVAGGPVTTLASFNNTDGEHPEGGVTLSADGSTLYGATYQGGTSGGGTVFSLPVTGGTPTTLVSLGGARVRSPWAI